MIAATSSQSRVGEEKSGRIEDADGEGGRENVSIWIGLLLGDRDAEIEGRDDSVEEGTLISAV